MLKIYFLIYKGHTSLLRDLLRVGSYLKIKTIDWSSGPTRPFRVDTESSIC